MASLKGKVIAITGGASGIGRATAEILANQGALLSLADRNETLLAEVKQELEAKYESKFDEGKSNVITYALDVTSQEQCNAWIQETVNHFGQPLAGAANIAGTIGKNMTKETGSIRNITDEEFDFIIKVNLKGILNALRAELPHMQEGTKGRGGGAIVNASSIAGLQGVLNNSPYVASKHAVAGITRTLALEEGKRGIRVNAIAPGIIDTPMLKQLASENEGDDAVANVFGDGFPGALARLGDASEVGDVVSFLLGPQSSFITGVILSVDGGMIC